MLFEWDDAKSERNRRQRGFGFDYAALIFEKPTLEKADARRDYGETRIQAVGRVGANVLFVVYTDRDGIRRIISARKANPQEHKLWQSHVNP